MGFDQVFHLGKLAQDLTQWMTYLIPTVGGGMIGYHMLARHTAQDETTAVQHTRAVRNVLIGSALGTGASALINLILSNYVAR